MGRGPELEDTREEDRRADVRAAELRPHIPSARTGMAVNTQKERNTHIAQQAREDAHPADGPQYARCADPRGPAARKERDPALRGEPLDEHEHEEREGDEREREALEDVRRSREDCREFG